MDIVLDEMHFVSLQNALNLCVKIVQGNWTMDVNRDVYGAGLIKLVYECLNQVSGLLKKCISCAKSLRLCWMLQIIFCDHFLWQDPAKRPTAEQILDQPVLSCCRQ